MATTAYLIPGGGIVVDTEQDVAELIPGLGLYVEQETGEPPAGWAHSFCGVSTPGKVDGVANANIGKVMGVAA